MHILPLLALLFAVDTITPAELQAKLEKQEAVVIDVRGSVPYDLGHIDGAISMPLGLIAKRFDELPQDKLIVAYCSCKREEISDEAVRELAKKGFDHAAALKGGYDAWVAAGLPVVPAPEPPSPSGGRFRVPEFVTCSRSDVTAYVGEVVSYKRAKNDKTVLRIHTDAATTEEVTATPAAWFVLGSKFTPADWKRIEVKKGKLRPHMRAIAWVCRNSGATFIDWRVGEKAPTGD
jgi:rhodanese-related sulfurtransferase